MDDIYDMAKKKPKRGSGKERASKPPDWARGQVPRAGERGRDFAQRLMDEKYGKDGWSETGPGSEYNQIKKYGDRGFEDP